MIFYRVAFRSERFPVWQWKSTALTSLSSMFTFLSFYGFVPQDRVRVFFASSEPLLEQMLLRENRGLASNSMMADLLYSGRRSIHAQEMLRLEAELAGEERRGVTKVLPLEDLVPVPAGRAYEVVAQESGPGGDHDRSYRFMPANSWLQARMWMTLLAKVQRGELEP